MKKLFNNVKEKFNKTSVKAVAMVDATLAAIVPGYCTDVNGQVAKVINTIFGLIQVAGIIMIALGVVQLVRCVMSLTSGDQLQPGQLGKAIGMIVAGMVAAAIQGVLTAFGISTSVSIFS